MNINVPILCKYLGIAGVLVLFALLIFGFFAGWFASAPRAKAVAGTWEVDFSQPPEPTKQSLPPGVDITAPLWLEAATVVFTVDTCSLRLKDKDPVIVPCTYLGIVPDRILIQLDRVISKQAAWPLPSSVSVLLDPGDRNHATFSAEYWSVTLKRVVD